MIEWEEDPYLHSIDHYPILLALIGMNCSESLRIHKWKAASANWDTFVIDANLQQDHDTINNQFYCNIVYIIYRLPETNIFVVYIQQNVYYLLVPWCHPNIRTTIKDIQWLFKTFQAQPTSANKVAFKKARAKVKPLHCNVE